MVDPDVALTEADLNGTPAPLWHAQHAYAAEGLCLLAGTVQARRQGPAAAGGSDARARDGVERLLRRSE
jgi:hypothetical protein